MLHIRGMGTLAIRRHVAWLALASAAGLAHAQSPASRITFEGSTDLGVTWFNAPSAPRGVLPGTTLLVRVRVDLPDAAVTTVLGLSGCTFQPTLSGWSPADVRLPFTNLDGTGVPEEPQTGLGRILPFASSGMGSASASGLLTSFVDGGNTLRFAGAHCVTPTTNLSWGVATGQAPPSIAGTDFRFGSDVVVFRYGVVLNGPIGRTYQATVDLSTIVGGRAGWHRQYAFSEGILAPVGEIVPLNIEIAIPSPSTLALLIAMPLARRSRRRLPRTIS